MTSHLRWGNCWRLFKTIDRRHAFDAAVIDVNSEGASMTGAGFDADIAAE